MHPGHSIGAVYLYRPAIDFRKSIGGLSALVEQELGLNPFGDALYLFINRRRDKLKALYWHRNGFCLWYKRLEAERFAWPPEFDSYARKSLFLLDRTFKNATTTASAAPAPPVFRFLRHEAPRSVPC